jgi:hypothetical protein
MCPPVCSPGSRVALGNVTVQRSSRASYGVTRDGRREVLDSPCAAGVTWSTPEHRSCGEDRQLGHHRPIDESGAALSTCPRLIMRDGSSGKPARRRATVHPFRRHRKAQAKPQVDLGPRIRHPRVLAAVRDGSVVGAGYAGKKETTGQGRRAAAVLRSPASSWMGGRGVMRCSSPPAARLAVCLILDRP